MCFGGTSFCPKEMSVPCQGGSKKEREKNKEENISTKCKAKHFNSIISPLFLGWSTIFCASAYANYNLLLIIPSSLLPPEDIGMKAERALSSFSGILYAL